MASREERIDDLATEDVDTLITIIIDAEEDRRELVERLEELTAACESSHRIAYVGWSYDKYEFAYETQVSNPVKRARSTLDKIKAREVE